MSTLDIKLLVLTSFKMERRGRGMPTRPICRGLENEVVNT